MKYSIQKVFREEFLQECYFFFFSLHLHKVRQNREKYEGRGKVETINYGIRIGIQIYTCKECTYTQLDRVLLWSRGCSMGACCQIQLTTVFINMQWRVRNTYMYSTYNQLLFHHRRFSAPAERGVHKNTNK